MDEPAAGERRSGLCGTDFCRHHVYLRRGPVLIGLLMERHASVWLRP